MFITDDKAEMKLQVFTQQKISSFSSLKTSSVNYLNKAILFDKLFAFFFFLRSPQLEDGKHLFHDPCSSFPFDKHFILHCFHICKCLLLTPLSLHQSMSSAVRQTITGRKNAMRESYRGYIDLCAKKTDIELHMAREGHSLFL